ncbi:MAG: ABC transporter substrate-binding protein [Burkholderiales bacterium]
MNRRESVAALLALVATPRWLRAAEGKRPRIGYLVLEPIRELPSRERQAFLDGLRDFGLREGQSLDIVYRSAENEPEFLGPMCEELVRDGVDVLATVGALPTLACLRTTRTTPIVFLAAGDPIGIGAAETLARPGRNATGVSYILSDLAGKRVEFLRRVVPKARRVAFLWDPTNRESQLEIETARASAATLGIRTDSIPVNSQATLSGAFERIVQDRPDALYVSFVAGVIARNRTAIAEFGIQHRLPLISGWSYITEAGGLLSYSPDIEAMFRRSAYYVDRILKGAQPGALPIEQATKIELVVNLGTARKLGITLPPEVLLHADRVIE